MQVTPKQLKEWKEICKNGCTNACDITNKRGFCTSGICTCVETLITAMPALIEEVERLREALSFYANPKYWKPVRYDYDDGWFSIVDDDEGKTAKQALGIE